MFCENLNLSDYTDWHLPDQKTLKKLFKNKRIFDLLSNRKWYWSSSTKKNNEKEYVWIMNKNGNWANAQKDSRKSYTLCTRKI